MEQNGECMRTSRQKILTAHEDEMKSHYDFSKGEKPNYAKRFPECAVITVNGTNGKRQKRIKVEDGVNLEWNGIRCNSH